MSEQPGPVVTTPLGQVRGLDRGGHSAFLGIPFAEPPVGPLRLAPPVPVFPWEGVRPAIRSGPTPLRVTIPGAIPEPAVPGRATLNLSVFTPAADPRAALPVLVWIHGGAYLGGSPASPWYDGASFARDGVVTVVISYRLGFDGFGAIPGEPANLAVRDWLCALEWVHDNIAAFGGDPSRVTIAGQSAGAGAVLTLVAMPAAQGLFRAAWASSPVLPVRTRADGEDISRRLAKRLGVAPTREALAAIPERRILAHQLVAARVRGHHIGDVIDLAPPYSPVVDGDLIPQPSTVALEQGVGRDVELVVGSNDDEIAFERAWLDLIPAELALRATGLAEDTAQQYRATLRHDGVVSALPSVGRVVTDRVFRRQVVRVARARHAAGARTWVYRFSWASPVKGAAVHCLDVPFFWDMLGEDHVAALAGQSPPSLLAETLHGEALALIHAAGPRWPAWEEPGHTVAVFDDGEPALTVVDDGYAQLDALL